MLKSVSSYYLPDYEKKCTKIIDYGNKEILKCNTNIQYEIINKLKNNNTYIKNSFHKYIHNYVNENRNIFNGKLKFSKKSLLLNDNVFIGIRAIYESTNLIIEIFLLNSLPYIMQNKEIYFAYSSLIKSNIEKFNLNIISKKFGSNNSLADTLFELLNIVYDNMLNS